MLRFLIGISKALQMNNIFIDILTSMDVTCWERILVETMHLLGQCSWPSYEHKSCGQDEGTRFVFRDLSIAIFRSTSELL